MPFKRAADQAGEDLEHLDALMDSYLGWRAAARAVSESYREWGRAGRRDRAVAFARYAAALDHEEAAAARYSATLRSMLPEAPGLPPHAGAGAGGVRPYGPGAEAPGAAPDQAQPSAARNG
jgi:hypothetical protein